MIQKSGSGNIYIPQAVNNLQLVQSGKGVSSFAAVNTVRPTHQERSSLPLRRADVVLTVADVLVQHVLAYGTNLS